MTMLVRISVILGLLTLPRLSVNAVDDKLPSFGEPVQNVTAVKGRDARLVCVTENLGNYKVAWVKVDTQTILTIGSHLITRDYQISLTQSDGRVWNLRISNVDRDDTGWYMCQINTDPMLSQKGYLEVVESPDISLTESSNDMSVFEDEDTWLRCVARGYPTPAIKWFREDGGRRTLVSGPDVSMNGTYISFSPVKRHHMAVYLCIASNGIAPSVSKRIVLNVQFPPKVTVPAPLLSAAQGTSVSLQCDTEAFPRSVVYWLKANTGVVASGKKYEEEEIEDGYKLTMRLHIRKVDGTDFTSYKCVAKNPQGEAEGTIRLTERQPTPEERAALRSDSREREEAEQERRRQLEREAAREAARQREQRRRQEESRRQRERQRQLERQNRRRPDRTGPRDDTRSGTSSAGGEPGKPASQPSAAAAVRRPGWTAELTLLIPLLLLLLAAVQIRA